LERGWQPTAYQYTDATGAVVYEKLRLEFFDSAGVRIAKTFRQRHRNDNGNVVENLRGIEPLPYRLEEMAANPDATVWVVEGEKCADAVAETGRTATSVSKWTADIVAHFRGRDVVVVPDNDDPGRRIAAQAEAALRPVAKTLRLASLPSSTPRKKMVGISLTSWRAAATWPTLKPNLRGRTMVMDLFGGTKSARAAMPTTS
jgi:hypothetical protein